MRVLVLPSGSVAGTMCSPVLRKTWRSIRFFPSCDHDGLSPLRSPSLEAEGQKVGLQRTPREALRTVHSIHQERTKRNWHINGKRNLDKTRWVGNWKCSFMYTTTFMIKRAHTLSIPSPGYLNSQNEVNHHLSTRAMNTERNHLCYLILASCSFDDFQDDRRSETL